MKHTRKKAEIISGKDRGCGEQQTLKDRTYLPPISNCMQKREGEVGRAGRFRRRECTERRFIAENGDI
jgi:hypothetical protein